MKNLILLCAFLISHIVFGQMPYDSIAKQFVYENVVSIKDSATQETIYKNAKHWLTGKLYSSDNMIQLDDKNFSVLTGTGHIKLENIDGLVAVENNYSTFKITIYCKNSKYKYKIDNFRHFYTVVTTNAATKNKEKHDYESALEETKIGKKRKEKTYTEINDYILALIRDLDKAMNTGAATQNDW